MKIKKKTMNKIHNGMVRRFSPYWDRKNVQMEELRADMASIMLQIEELKQLAEPKAVEEEPKKALAVTQPTLKFRLLRSFQKFGRPGFTYLATKLYPLLTREVWVL